MVRFNPAYAPGVSGETLTNPKIRFPKVRKSKTDDSHKFLWNPAS